MVGFRDERGGSCFGMSGVLFFVLGDSVCWSAGVE